MRYPGFAFLKHPPGRDWDPSLIFLQPGDTGEEDMARAVGEMLSREQGTTSYRFRGRERTVLFHRSPVSGWWHVFAVVPVGREKSPTD